MALTPQQISVAERDSYDHHKENFLRSPSLLTSIYTSLGILFIVVALIGLALR